MTTNVNANRRSIPSFVAAGLALVPPIALIVVHAVWSSAPSKVPSHFEGNGTADGFSSSSAVFTGSLIPALIVALIAIAIAVFGGGFDPLKRAGALGIVNLISAVASLAWVVFSLSEVNAEHGGSANIGPPFLLFLCALGWGGLVFLMGFAFSRNAQ